MVRTGKVAALFALAATMTAGQAQACWSNTEQDAAKVANLNMMMMVSALRCRKGPDDFLSEYNRFVKLNNATIGSQNAVVREHFARVGGFKNAEAAMDKFIIGIANSYGSGHQDLGCMQLKALAQELSNNSHSVDSLLVVADSYIAEFPLAGGKCPVMIASK